ncbi:MAG: hypothetical protein QOD44_2222, partial [Solirubrobacteraceae bacterium]|nr:hypothetical protein [Solirubrobacteraceae bacterium]
MSSHPDISAAQLESRLFQLARDPLVVTKADGQIVHVNPAAGDLAGRTAEELLGSSFWDLIHPADHGAVVAQLQQLGQEGGADPGPVRCRVLRGEHLWRWVEASATYDADTGLLFA